MQKLHKVKVESVEYQIQELLATDRHTLMLEIAQLAGTAVSGFGMDDDIDAGKIISGLMKNGNPREMALFIKQTILDSVAFPRMDTDTYELHFCEHYSHTVDVLEEIFILNFGTPIQRIKKKLLNNGILGRIFSNRQPEPTEDTTSDSTNTSGSSGKSVKQAKQLSAK